MFPVFNSAEIQKILVIKLREIGDVLLSVPVLRALSDAFPKAHVAVMVRSGTQEVLEGIPFIHEILVYDKNIKSKDLFSRLAGEFQFLQQVRSGGFDLTVDLTTGDRAAFLSLLSGAKYRLAYPTQKGFLGKNFFYTHLGTKNTGQHMVLHHLALLRQFGIPCGNARLEMHVSEEDRTFARRQLNKNNPLVHVHPVSRLLHKCWKNENMAKAIDHLMQKGFDVVVTASSDAKEMARVKDILSLVKGKPFDLSGRTTLKQLAAISEMSALFIGVDSAPMHIAAAVNVPVVGLFGPSSETLWAPWCEKHLVISKDMACRLPCKNKRACRTYECMNEITFEEFIARVDQFIDETAFSSALSR